MIEDRIVGPEDAITVRRAEASKAAHQRKYLRRAQILAIGEDGLSSHISSVWTSGH